MDKDSASSDPPAMSLRKSPPLLIRFLALTGAGLLCSVVAYGCLSTMGDYYPTPPEVLSLGAAPTVEETAAAKAAQLEVDHGNAMIWLGLCGGIFGCGLALIHGLVNRAGNRIWVSTLAAIIAAGIIGAFAGRLAITAHRSVTADLVGDRSAAETQFMMIHAIGWASIGAATGLCLGLAASEKRSVASLRMALVGLIAGGIAGAAYPTTVGIIAPLIDASNPMPVVGTGLAIWLGLPGLILGVAFGRAS